MFLIWCPKCGDFGSPMSGEQLKDLLGLTWTEPDPNGHQNIIIYDGSN